MLPKYKSLIDLFSGESNYIEKLDHNLELIGEFLQNVGLLGEQEDDIYVSNPMGYLAMVIMNYYYLEKDRSKNLHVSSVVEFKGTNNNGISEDLYEQLIEDLSSSSNEAEFNKTYLVQTMNVPGDGDHWVTITVRKAAKSKHLLVELFNPSNILVRNKDKMSNHIAWQWTNYPEVLINSTICYFAKKHGFLFSPERDFFHILETLQADSGQCGVFSLEHIEIQPECL